MVVEAYGEVLCAKMTGLNVRVATVQVEAMEPGVMFVKEPAGIIIEGVSSSQRREGLEGEFMMPEGKRRKNRPLLKMLKRYFVLLNMVLIPIAVIGCLAAGIYKIAHGNYSEFAIIQAITGILGILLIYQLFTQRPDRSERS